MERRDGTHGSGMAGEDGRPDGRLARVAIAFSIVACLAVAAAACCLFFLPHESADPAPEAEDAVQGRAAGEAEEASEEADALPIVEDCRAEFSHGEKGAEHQRYIVLHDTEVDAAPGAIVNAWDGSDNGVAAHFVIGRDGTIVQCVPLDEIAHHAGYGDAGHNDLFGIAEDGRDDMVGTTPIGDWAPDYAMNAWSVGIEIVHVGGQQDYTTEQLESLDALIAHIDVHYGFESEIIDHKAWRTGNSDTSAEFAPYLESYQTARTHDGRA